MKKSVLFCLGAIVCSAIFVSDCFAIEAWPGGAGEAIATYPDASGAVWHEGRQSLFVVQNTGTLRELDSEGTLKDSWSVPGDLEGITLAGNDRFLYIGIENPDSIVEFDLQTEALTGKSWELTSWMASVDPNQGLEGLAYRGGYFLAGLQADGKIYIFNLNLSVSGEVSHVETVTPFDGYADIAGIDYNAKTGNAYALFDSNNALLELNSSNEIVKNYSLPGTAQEGFAMKTNCLERKADVYVTNDDSGIITKYTDYPITCLDADADGVNYATDCNDYNAAISANQNYYRDADGDGLGASAATTFCSLTAPAGYVTNSSDQNDSDFVNDGSPTGVDCSDNDNSISQSHTFYRDADGDGLGDAFTFEQICSLAAPEGYVANSNDPADISLDGRYFTVNGKTLDIFGINVSSVAYADLNFLSDNYHEIIAVGLVGKKAYITVARVKGGEATIAKRRLIKKRYKTAQITTQISKNKFTTRFNRKKKYVWKVKSSGSFSKSH